MPELNELIGQTIVLDLVSTYVCIGRLDSDDDPYFRLSDADLHDFRDSTVTRENYVSDSVRLGIRRNRKQVLIRKTEVVAITRFGDISDY